MTKMTPQKKRHIALMNKRGYGPTEIADALGLPVGTVTTYIYAAKLNTRPKRTQESMMSCLGRDYVEYKK